MAQKTIRIGSMVDVIVYDDGDWDAAIETDHTIKAAAPVDSNDVIRLGDMAATVQIMTDARTSSLISNVEHLARKANLLNVSDIIQNQVFGQRF